MARGCLGCLTFLFISALAMTLLVIWVLVYTNTPVPGLLLSLVAGLGVALLVMAVDAARRRW